MSTTNIVTRQLERISERAVLVLLENMIWPILAVISLLILVTVPRVFTNAATLELMLFAAVPLGLIVLAESICLLSGHFDLSVGAIAGFSAVFTAMVLAEWNLVSNPVLGVLIVLAVGCTIGATNGIMIAKLGMNPFLQTLAFFIIFGGGKLALTTQPISGLPDGYVAPGDSALVAIGILLASFACMVALFRYTAFGQAVYAVGSDEDAARAVGIRTDRTIIAVYTLSGFFCAIAGWMLTGYTGLVSPDIADDMVFPAFAAAIVGGISLLGGRGKLLGALGGVLLLSLIETALNVSGVDPTLIEVVNGIVLLIAILLYNTKESVRERVLSAGVRR
ncbi:ABC transporter permease [Natrialba asiatica]|uniref:Sugar ABC transporter integral membrane subunit n=1 Tax=Natrialba asiatica (strain ATCC 700177 / DSM 12278 / JCM 9576 / FERM P-10747 / NBRC 102637 / 172P1) TaxID=29540 RepID=M0B5C5_NATA1|nr:ABC transporter permease [Natrialba asiatica]ELZ05990.1 sugar ABC transporter integral membrane subunit [Natrialba asiatica DSM 12278]